MKKIIITFVILLAVLAGVFYLKSQNGTVANNPTNSPTPSPSASPTPSNIVSNVPSDWKTYKNQSFGFELKYPNEWQYKPVDSEIICFGKTITIVKQNIEGGRPTRCDGDHVLIWAQSGSMTDLEATIADRQKLKPNVEIRRFTIDGVNAATIYETNGAETFFSSLDGKISYTITLGIENNQNISLWRTYYESMLSSFKFTAK